MSIPIAGRVSVFHRSLAAQAVLLVVIVTAATAGLVGSLAARRMAASLVSELDRRGSSLATMLERHKDLHAAALRRDAAGAEQVLQLVVSSDLEMEYAGLLDSHGALIAAAARDGAEAMGTVRSQLRNHPLDTPGLANADERVRRFTQAVAADEGERGVWAGADEQLYNPGTTIGYVVLGMRDRGAVLARDQAAVTVAGVGAALAGAFLLYFHRSQCHGAGERHPGDLRRDVRGPRGGRGRRAPRRGHGSGLTRHLEAHRAASGGDRWIPAGPGALARAGERHQRP